MRKLLLFLTIAITVLAFHADAKKRALLVGISNYQEAGLGWSNLHATNDLDTLGPMLRNAGFHVMELRNNAATHHAICKQLDMLAARCKEGDKVLIHFSGHGQQMVNIKGDKGGHTETFIPFDAAKFYCDQDKGDKHLTDDELYIKLKAIKDSIGKTGQLMVTVDACHSGNITRSFSKTDNYSSRTHDKELGIRGASNLFGEGILKSARQTKDQPPIPGDFEISACGSNDISIEYRDDDGKIYGPLSYLLVKGIKAKNGNVSFSQLYKYVYNNYKLTMTAKPYSRRASRK